MTETMTVTLTQPKLTNQYASMHLFYMLAEAYILRPSRGTDLFL
jgi:hypothetical protein